MLLEHIKQRHLVQLPVPPVSLVSQDPPIRPLRVPLRGTGRVQHVLYVQLAHGEVQHVQQRRTRGVPVAWLDLLIVPQRMLGPVQPVLLLV